ncbi:hypothetical protein OG967_38775 [Streptomyces phaeochromogenes]
MRRRIIDQVLEASARMNNGASGEEEARRGDRVGRIRLWTIGSVSASQDSTTAAAVEDRE